MSAEGLFPAVGMHSMGEEVRVDLQAEWFLEEDDSMMMVDSHEDDWSRLFDVRVSGTVSYRHTRICDSFFAVSLKIYINFNKNLNYLYWVKNNKHSHLKSF